MKRILILLFFFLPISAQAEVPSFSTWINTRGSALSVFFVDPATGAFSGTYVNRAAGFECQDVPYAAVGASKGTSVTFRVDWKGVLIPDCHSTTVWTGLLVGSTLKTKWRLDYTGSDGKPHTMYGRDVFTKQ
ncbi:avidin/streptavidin family protein [Bradyrhizobium sp. SZCCHNRI1002]|uniref:avidin/streptavidin family protein n=1 Tax=Bradyrhizobium sp. SZCCHNRI1002 TaxID=3057274 RepID=UPI0028E2EF98|nr:avidin/streptavidin family protein [Bradyrhizobium sp. SZCCHNRI1002]